jgi:hypothetical protein
MGRAMDPYRTLGITRGCSLEEVKRAYRAKAWQTHPDLGGDGPTFIEVCEAYKLILQDMAQRPGRVSLNPALVHGINSSPNRYDRRTQAARRTSGQVHAGIRKPKPPDPLWNPDLVIQDHPVWIGYRSRPPDPAWEPELILLEEEPTKGGVAPPSGSQAIRESSVPWLPPIPARSARRRSCLTRRQTAFGIAILLGMIVLALVTLLPLAWRGDAGTAP